LEHVTGARHLWEVALGPDRSRAESEKLTDSVEWDCCPAVSGDGHSVFFSRKISDFRQLMKVDVQSGQESIVYSSQEEKLWPLPDYAGRTVAFELKSNNQSSVALWSKNGVRTLCTGCSQPRSWIQDGRELLFTDNSGDIAALDVVSGKSRVVLAAGGRGVLSYPDYNRYNRHLLFTLNTGSQKQLFAVELPADSAQPVGSWMQLSPQNETAYIGRWSTDGENFYYFSQKDGYTCIWGNSFDPVHHAVGKPFPVKHYHERDRGPGRTAPDELGLSVSADHLYLNPAEVNVTIWEATLHRNALFNLFRRVFRY
jgi:eukaryotic-like serine/threonine-protein kinase